MRLSRRILSICLGLYFAAQIAFLINIQFPRGYDFDEFHYVPSAKQFLQLEKNQNWEHPPLAKEIMAVGIAIGDDRPFGWRVMSTVFGSLTLVGMFLWGLAVFGDESTALLVAAITFVNQLLYVQARIGMLDTFMFGFLVWGIAAFSACWDERWGPPTQKKLLAFTGVMFGLATSCKWFAVIPWVACIAAIILVRIFQQWGVSFQNPKPDDWYRPNLFPGVRTRHVALFLVIVPVLTYFIPFLPYLWIPGEAKSLTDLLTMQVTMYEGQLRVVNSHPYMSDWKSWALMIRPIWYAFDHEGAKHEWVRGVLMLGNPLVMWTGLLALVACLWAWLTERSRAAFLVLGFYATFYLSWAVIPRKIAFYYYYYPAGMTLSLALAFVFYQWEYRLLHMRWARWMYVAAALGVFAHFFPILAALRIPADQYREWMWLSSWI